MTCRWRSGRYRTWPWPSTGEASWVRPNAESGLTNGGAGKDAVPKRRRRSCTCGGGTTEPTRIIACSPGRWAIEGTDRPAWSSHLVRSFAPDVVDDGIHEVGDVEVLKWLCVTDCPDGRACRSSQLVQEAADQAIPARRTVKTPQAPERRSRVWGAQASPRLTSSLSCDLIMNPGSQCGASSTS